jgi:hypothetical protein
MNDFQKLNMDSVLHQTRRHFFAEAGLSLGSIALANMLSADSAHAFTTNTLTNTVNNPMAPRPAMIPARAKHVIYLHMAGSPSQLDLFDDKPELRKYNGKPCPEELLKGKRFAFIRGVPNMLGSPYKFYKTGDSGVELSELWKYLPSVIDRFAVLKTVKTDQFNHAPAQLFLHTGTNQFGGASMGAWATYGLGSENADLPGFVVLTSGGKTPDAGKSVWGSGFLPSVFQGVQCRSEGEPVLFLKNPEGMDQQGRRRTLDTLRQLNEIQAREIGDPETVTRIAQFELAYRMQIKAPEVMDISREPKHILEMYGAIPGFVPESDSAADPRVAYKPTDAQFANNCLLARRLVESGVRFVQLFDWGWDHHGISPGEDIVNTLPIKVGQIDKAITALVKDLDQRGLLNETLIVWGGEFGRTPMAQNSPNQKFPGRDHHPYAFTMMMAGAGIKGGQTIGKTDEIGYYAVENPIDIRDIQATVLNQLGLDPWNLKFSYQGLEQRLIGVEGKAKIPPGLIS